MLIYIYIYYMLLNKLPSNKLPAQGPRKGVSLAGKSLNCQEAAQGAQGPRKDFSHRARALAMGLRARLGHKSAKVIRNAYKRNVM